jgi:uncharacterized protein YdeI (YjbR/CyaY-like superfamily)
MAGEHYQRIEVTTRKALREWLSKHHTQNASIWLITWKKPDTRHVAYNDVVEEALCFGWVDSLPRKLDAQRSMLLLSPRKPKSAWSKLNRDRAERLMAEGLMAPAGLKVVKAAQVSGMWTKLDTVEALEIPPDLDNAFLSSKTARNHFDAFPKSVKRGILEWILQAKKPETRMARIAETVEKAKDNIRANQWRQPSGK